jgi:1-aminocyclopropane-1-carboxylate deaminase/D-cysteine desulfhydrase-like pyridoxal-dependent ACC family enzyme
MPSARERLSLGTYPTPVDRVDALSTPRAELWIKNDGLVSAEYGGNKVRKLELILPRALERGAKRLLTVGAAGSHQVLATALYGKKVGLPTAAVLCPQPFSVHAESMLRASLALGIEPHLVGSMSAIAAALPRVVRRGDYVLAPGGSSVTGTLGYLHAVAELVDQIRAGVLPEPDTIVAPLGSGGTIAGLLAGVLREGLATRVVGVEVAVRPPLGRALALGLALAATRRDAGSAGLVRLARQLEVLGTYLGEGYGYPTPEGARAQRVAGELGLELDPTYTAKTFAAVLDLLERAEPRDRPLRILYWHTLSAAPLTALLAGAPGLAPQFRALLPQAH